MDTEKKKSISESPSREFSTVIQPMDSNAFGTPSEVYFVSNRYRWMMVILGGVAGMFIGPTFMNWPPLRTLIDRSGAYSHLCVEGDSTLVWKDGIAYCNAKAMAVDILGGLSVSMMFVFSFVAGLLLDFLGAKICSVVGMCSQILGWILFACSGPTVNLYKAAIIFLAAGADPSLFGLLSIANLFPTRSSTVVAVFGAARSLSFAIPLAMEAAFLSSDSITFRGISLFYAGVLFFWLIVFVIMLPFVPYPKLPPGSLVDDPEKDPLLPQLQKRPKFSWTGIKSGTVVQVKEFLKYGVSWGYLALVPLPIFTFIRNTYYSMSYQRTLGDVVTFYTIMNPLSVIPCPVFGYIADRFSASIVLITLSASGALSMFLVMFPNVAFQHISVMLNWLFMSFVASQYYVYVAAVYPQRQMGKLVGIVLLLGGLFSTFSTWMHEASVDGAHVAMDLIVVAMGVVGCIIGAGLWFFVEKPAQRERKELELKNAEAAGKGEFIAVDANTP